MPVRRRIYLSINSTHWTVKTLEKSSIFDGPHCTSLYYAYIFLSCLVCESPILCLSLLIYNHTNFWVFFWICNYRVFHIEMFCVFFLIWKTHFNMRHPVLLLGCVVFNLLSLFLFSTFILSGLLKVYPLIVLAIYVVILTFLLSFTICVFSACFFLLTKIFFVIWYR